ncbi:fatty acid hydroxylase superfamily-domain-containing protein [Chytridium lagenaria]|nr:fatty acid hydroxylase superfamily-domain-containing protein [Chytridium lagenaria]
MIFLPILCYWAYSTLLYVLSHLNLTLVELHRIPTNQPRRPKNRVTVSKVLWTVAFQHVVQAIVALVVVVLTRPADVANWKMEPVWLVLAKFWIGTIILDTYQYWLHRAAHTYPFLYKNFHSWHHQLTAPYAFGALYNHPLEGLMMDTVGGALPSLLLDMHPWTSCIFYCIATLKTVDDHCGYSWPLSPFRLLGRNDAEYHDIHHWGKGIKYNFSQPFYTFWDRIMGTEYHAAMERLEEVEMQKKAVAEALAAEEKKSLPKSKSSLGGSPAAVRMLPRADLGRGGLSEI